MRTGSMAVMGCLIAGVVPVPPVNKAFTKKRTIIEFFKTSNILELKEDKELSIFTNSVMISLTNAFSGFGNPLSIPFINFVLEGTAVNQIIKLLVLLPPA